MRPLQLLQLCTLALEIVALLRLSTPFPSFLQAAALYGYSTEGGEAVPVQSTFQMIFMAGWAPGPTQQRAAKRGSATASMKDIQDAVNAAKAGQASD